MISTHVRMAVVGLLFGFAFSCMGFTDFGEVHKMFTLQDFRLLLTFCGGVALSTVGFLVLARGKALSRRAFHKGTIPGGILFGAGWALTGACPTGALVQVGEGKVLAGITVLGIFFGAWVYPLLHRSLFRWPLQACDA
jgi:uncharacterized membrane protein YedE/YeeE